MDDEAIKQVLRERGHGVLSLARDSEAYAIPVSFGYDGERALMYLLQFGEDSEKLAVASDTEQACLVTYNVETRFEWESVILRGSLRELPTEESEDVEAVMDENAWFPSIFPPDAPITGVHIYELVIESASGRQGEGVV
ncbi:pyridoxamine 5'-phosphate oxidase family protein [Halorubrum trueperi]|uniref:Pyridoxamine 5'-phosphate oxidase family protein n=1 Tax=Halorubrum trueperi TaxID=2004704 RepID=A0ABD5UGU1_9EURY